MAKTFAYKAKNRTGQLMSGTIVADSEAAVAAHIRAKGHFITLIKEVREQESLTDSINNLMPIKIKDIAVWCWQFATMIDAGMSLITALNTLIEQTTHPKLKAAVKDVLKKVQEGDSLSQAMSNHPKVFPSLMINMVEAGELGGVLDEVLSRLAVHFEKEHKMNEKVQSAMTYPAVVICMAILAVVFVLTFVLPTFVKMLEGMKVELPLLTRLLLAVSSFLTAHWLFLLVLVVVIILGLTYLYKQPKFRLAMEPILLNIPVFGMLTKKIAIARFTRTFGTLLRGGVPIITALDVVKKTTENLTMTNALSRAQDNIREGIGLASPLRDSNIFSPMVIQMVAVGEETGELDKMLDKIADFYESDVEDVVSRLSSLLEPLLIAFLGMVIGGIVLAVAIPMFDAVTAVGR